jgi:ribosomal protein L40E
MIGILVALGISLATGTDGAADEHFQYVGAKKCRTCHKKELMGNQQARWREGKHAGAFESLASEKALEFAKAKGIEGSPQEAEECVKCHVTAFGVDPAGIKYELSASDGVQCEACHGPGSRYRKKKVMSDHDKSVANGMVEQSADVCTTCHNDESPAWNPEQYALADGSKVGFDFEQAKEQIAHPIPAEVKGNYIALEKKLKAEKKARGEAVDEEEED